MNCWHSSCERTIRRPWLLSVALLELAVLVALSSPPQVVAGRPEQPAEITPQQAQYFEMKVRPLLAAHCYKCHGANGQKGGLRVDSLASLLAGGEGHGPAIIPGKPEESVLIHAVRHDDLEMPPSIKLGQPEIDVLVTWIRMGAPWPESARQPVFSQPHWSFRPVARPNIPLQGQAAVAGNPIDAFVRSRLETAGLRPAEETDRATLVRRATFDLLGLPPSPEEVRAFVADGAPDAYERLLDRLLASPHYGERWGRHWLDLVRYAQTNGYERDDEKPFAWHYRDYVIRAFNEDKPFNRFVLEQLAGDELPDVTPDAITATAFYRLGPWDDEPDDVRQAMFDGYDDMLSTVGSAFLGMTVACARCHDHKFDPLPQVDYYRMLAFLRNVRYYQKPEGKTRNTVLAALPGGGETLGVSEYGMQARPTHVLLRGLAASPGAEVAPRFPQALCDSDSACVPQFSPPSGGKTSGRRRALAEWIARRENPLTARVIVNRIWQHHFGRGLVATPNDFGMTGSPPSHPELLDWLASDLTEHGWRLKRLQKQIMMSSTYRQTSLAVNKAAAQADPDNVLLWRQSLRRLEAEAVRDTMLAASGRLNKAVGGPSFYPPLPAQVIGSQSMPGRGWSSSDLSNLNRRSVYVFSKRSLQVPLLEVFDAPSTDQSISARSQTTVAPQALSLMNGDFVNEQADAFARRLRAEAGPGAASQIQLAYWLALGRAPTDGEMTQALGFIQRQSSRERRTEEAWMIEPSLPSALHKSFLEHADPTAFLKGPRRGWSYYQGDWRERGEGIFWVQAERGPVALVNGVTFQDGTLCCSIKLHRNADLAAIAFRAQPHQDVFRGYEFYVDSRNGSAALNRLEKSVTTLASAEVSLPPDRWHTVRIESGGNSIRVWLNEDSKPCLEIQERNPLPGAGAVGLRSWGAPLTFRDFTIMTQQWNASIRGDAVEPVEQRALTAFCKIVFNLNEFVYID